MFDWLRKARPAALPRAQDRVGMEKKEAGYGFVALHLQGEAGWTRAGYAPLAREGYGRNPVVFRCVRLIAHGAASMPWLLFRGDRQLVDHPALALLNNPNPRQLRSVFLEMLVSHLVLAGDAYVEMTQAGGARELHVLRPDRVSVVAGADGWPRALDYQTGSARRRIALGDDAMALHLSLFDPLDDHYGHAPLKTAAMAIDIHNAACRWNKALLDNSARPSGALVYAPRDGGSLSDEQYERLKGELEQGYSGAIRAGRPLVLDGGLDWKTMGLTPRDMDFIDAKNSAARDIAMAFGVPPMLLGIPGDNTYANYKEANRAFWRLNVLPLAERVAADMAGWLSVRFGEDLRFVCDTDQVDAMAEDRAVVWRKVGDADFLTDDEKREAVGYGPRGE